MTTIQYSAQFRDSTLEGGNFVARGMTLRGECAGTDQLNAMATRLEHSSTKPAAVTARNPSETKS
jgi:hypothetical protein